MADTNPLSNPLSDLQLAQRLLDVAVHAADCRFGFSPPGEEGTAAVVTECTCRLEWLRQEVIRRTLGVPGETAAAPWCGVPGPPYTCRKLPGHEGPHGCFVGDAFGRDGYLCEWNSPVNGRAPT